MVDLLDSEPIQLSLNRAKAELVLKALGRLDGDDLAKVGDLAKALEDGLAPPDMSDDDVRFQIQHLLFVGALHDLLGKIPGRWVVWLDGKVHSDHATQDEAMAEHYRLASPDVKNGRLEWTGPRSLVCRVEPLLGLCIPGGHFVMDEFKKYVADWKHGWSYEQEHSGVSMGDSTPIDFAPGGDFSDFALPAKFQVKPTLSTELPPPDQQP